MVCCPVLLTPRLPITSFKSNIFRAEQLVFGVKVNHSVKRIKVRA